MFYSETIRARMVRRMVGPKAISATALAAETGISQSTLSRWLQQAGSLELKMKDDEKAQPDRRPRDWSTEEKLRAIVETADLEGELLGEYLRRNGLHAEQIEQWRAAATTGLVESTGSRRAASAEAKRIKELERELRRKEAALAETAALLVLRKKLNALWGDGDDDTDGKNEP